MKEIQNIYDNETFFKEYEKMRASKVNANELLEIPIMMSMMPEIKGKRVLDIGCGAGQMSRYFADNGATYVLGVDISSNMINLAQNSTTQQNVKYKILAMEYLEQLNEKFDIAFSSLAFNYVEDFDKLIKDLSNLLVEGGTLLFSQEHPLTTSFIKVDKEMDNYIEYKNKRYYLLSDYNNVGKRNLIWNIDGAIKYHRNFSTIINTLALAGFKIIQAEESKPNEKAVAMVEKYKYQNDKPYFLFIKAIKE